MDLELEARDIIETRYSELMQVVSARLQNIRSKALGIRSATPAPKMKRCPDKPGQRCKLEVDAVVNTAE